MWKRVSVGIVSLGSLIWMTVSPLVLIGQPPTGMVKSKLTVKLPVADAELLIEGRPTKSTGVIREFETPLLEPGKAYAYDFKATWRPNNYTVMSRSRSIKFKAGETIVVDLTKDLGTDKAVIRYVPTPPDIVEKMIELAKITQDDVSYELGCGDARITIAAVKAGAKKAVGIDLDADRIAEAKANIKAAGVEDRVEIRQGDALEVKDLASASIVFLYMGDEFNALVRPILWKQLPIGSRVVSHRFTMGDWKPDRTIKVLGNDGNEYELHLWNITETVKKRVASAAP
jgi:uncharacterized protein (TIGR03000 family)